MENSELRIRMQRLTKQHEEEMSNREEEFVVGKRVLEEEYKKKVQENGEMKDRMDQMDSDLESRGLQVQELQEIVSNQKQEIETIKKVRLLW